MASLGKVKYLLLSQNLDSNRLRSSIMQVKNIKVITVVVKIVFFFQTEFFSDVEFIFDIDFFTKL